MCMHIKNYSRANKGGSDVNTEIFHKGISIWFVVFLKSHWCDCRASTPDVKKFRFCSHPSKADMVIIRHFPCNFWSLSKQTCKGKGGNVKHQMKIIYCKFQIVDIGYREAIKHSSLFQAKCGQTRIFVLRSSELQNHTTKFSSK